MRNIIDWFLFALIMTILLAWVVGRVYAGECEVNHFVTYQLNGVKIYEKEKMKIHFEFFRTKQEALVYATRNNCLDNIIHDQDGGYYVFLTMPKDVFICEGMSNK